MRRQTEKKTNPLLIIIIIALVDARFLTSSFKFMDQTQPSCLLGEADDTIRASHPGENPQAYPQSTQPQSTQETCLIIYLFLLSLPCGLNTHLPLDVSDDKQNERLAEVEGCSSTMNSREIYVHPTASFQTPYQEVVGR